VGAVGRSHVIWWVPVNHPAHSEVHFGAVGLLYADAYVPVALTPLAIAARSAALGAFAPPRRRERGSPVTTRRALPSR
jgi:hypothetical protein